jgi:hypothetical protein
VYVGGCVGCVSEKDRPAGWSRDLGGYLIVCGCFPSLRERDALCSLAQRSTALLLLRGAIRNMWSEWIEILTMRSLGWREGHEVRHAKPTLSVSFARRNLRRTLRFLEHQCDGHSSILHVLIISNPGYRTRSNVISKIILNITSSFPFRKRAA